MSKICSKIMILNQISSKNSFLHPTVLFWFRLHDMKVPAHEVDINGGAQFRRLLLEVEKKTFAGTSRHANMTKFESKSTIFL